ncbi:hypothetical protein Tco_1016382 [Tanacetum coccineum]|uniref:Gag-Pol polyprotein n=1 Tax=Tanacetum coccineum TaxID=301880 RepID=A0ABQ5FQF4_9ASTR
MQQPMPNPKDITDPTTAMNMTLVLMAKAFKLNYSTLTNNNHRISSNPHNRQIVQPGIRMGIMQYRMSGIRIANQNPNGNGNVVASQAGGNAIGNNEAGIQLQAEEFDLMAAATDLDEIEEVNANYILMANLQKPSTSGTQTDKALVYDSNGSTEYTELLEPIPEPHQVQHNDSNVISEVSSVEQDGGTVDQNPATVEETHAYFELLYNNLGIEVENVNSEKSTVSSLLEEKKKLNSEFKIREDELFDKQIQLENKIKELDNILVKMGQSIQTMHMLSPKPDSFYHTEQKMALGYQNQQKQQSFYNGKVLLKKHDPLAMHDSEETLQLA